MANTIQDDQLSFSAGDETFLAPGAFKRLPDEIIEQILQTTDPDGFASLVLLNRKWRDVSQQPHLYYHQLEECPSYAANPSAIPEANDANLPELRRLFAREVKRNLFEAFLRPSETIIKLISTSISSSSAPGGEGMQFSPSPRGHHILAYNSSRIYVIDVRGDNYEIKRELKILRRPVSACIKDDGLLLAVLSTEMQVDLYDLETSPPRRRQSIILDNSPRAIAMSPCGSVLAAAYDGGIEVSSLNPSAVPTDKRAVKCDAVDALAFSFDGTQILGTTTHSASPSTVVLTAPYYDPGSQAEDDNISAMWTTSILFPNTSRDCSHAVLLQDGPQEEACWTFTYDRSFETFRAVRVEDLRNGTTYFTGPIPKQTTASKLLPSTLPAATFRGDLIASGFQGKEIWLYGIPEDLDAVPESGSSTNDTGSTNSGLGRRNSSQSGLSRNASNRTQEASSNRVVPQWQILCDKLRNTFVAGRKVAELNAVSNVKWVAGYGGTAARERLVVGAPGVTGPMLITEEDDMDFVDGGRLVLLDFDYRLTDGTRREITIEVGTDNAEVLEEEQRDLEAEVAIVRRRTVARNRSGGTGLLRTATMHDARTLAAPSVPAIDRAMDDPLVPRRIGRNPVSHTAPATDDLVHDDSASIEEQEALDAPYAHSSPRSGTTLRRAATAAAVNRRLNPRLADGTPVEYRRADGRAEHPHESDADNWVPPPPPYQKDDPEDVPVFLRGQAVAPQGVHVPPMPDAVGVAATSSDDKHLQDEMPGVGVQNDLRRSHECITRQLSQHRSARETAYDTRPASNQPVRTDVDDLYDVSPPDSPGPSNSDLVQSVSVTENGLPLTPPTVNAQSTGADASVPFTITGRGDRPNAPSLGLQIPSSDEEQRPSEAVSSSMNRIPNSQTWPLTQQAETGLNSSSMANYPVSAPLSHAMDDEFSSILPPLPTTTQIANLNKRVSQGNPRRLSGGFKLQRVPVGSRSRETRQDGYQVTPNSAESSNSWQSEPEQPLIISTPQGVTGSYDPPNRRVSGRIAERTIHAPVPRHPQPNPVLSRSEPMIERLETIYSVESSQRNSHDPPHRNRQLSTTQNNSRFLPSWLASGSTSSNRSSSVVNRRPSRAERSAAKNIQDAKKKGWKAKTKQNKKSKKKHAERDGASSAGAWTDVTVRSTSKDKTCVVM